MDRKSLVLLALLPLAAATPNPDHSTPFSGTLGSPTRSTSESLRSKRYVTAGDRAYEVGTLDGGFPPIGWHIRGRMNGVWAPPIKLLDSYRFLTNGEPFPKAAKFTSGSGYVAFEYPETNGLQVTRTVFAPDGVPAVLIGVTLRNTAGDIKSFRLALEATGELIAAYPWSVFTIPTSAQVWQPDNVRFEPIFSGLVFSAPDHPFYALVSGLPQTSNGQDSAHLVGASLADPAPGTTRPAAQLTWQVTLTTGHELKLWFTVAGSHTGPRDAYLAGWFALRQPEKWLRGKVAGRVALLDRSQAEIPNAKLQAAFDWAKLNLAEMRRVVTDTQVRNTQAGTQMGTVYPGPLATFPLLSGFSAGYPDYPWYFGTDGCYTVFPLVAAGQFETAEDHLHLLREVSRAVNGTTGKVLHEIVTDGSVYYGTNDQPGDANETAQFATAVATLWRWTGNDRVRDDNYQFIIDGLHYLTGELDSTHDGWPEGDGMMEITGMGAKKLEVAVYTIRALNDLADMAAAKGDAAAQTWAREKAEALVNRFEQDWWIPEQRLYADSLALNRGAPADFPAALRAAPVTKLQQSCWTTATPMETNLAFPEHADAAFPTLESPAFTGVNGVYQVGMGGGPAGKGDLQSCAHATAVLAVAEANYGRVDESLRYVLDIARQLDLEQPGALPEQMPSPDYPLFPFRPLTRRMMVMQAWSSYGVIYPVIHHFLGVEPHLPKRWVAVIPQLPGGLPHLGVRGLRIGNENLTADAQHSENQYVTEATLPAGYHLQIGHTLPVAASILSVTLNGEAVDYEVRSTHRGQEVVAQGLSGGAYKLVIQTR